MAQTFFELISHQAIYVWLNLQSWNERFPCGSQISSVPEKKKMKTGLVNFFVIFDLLLGCLPFVGNLWLNTVTLS